MRALCVSLLAVLLATASLCSAADPVRVPTAPPIPDAMPVTPPAPRPVTVVPGAPLKVTPELWYVIDSDIEVLILTSPEGLLKFNPEESGAKLKGRFADDPDKVQTRTFKGKHVFSAEPVGTGRVEVIVVPVGAKDAGKVVRRVVDVEAGEGPRPPPIDDDKKKKDGKEDKKDEIKPAPVASRVWVIVVEDAMALRTVDTARALNDPWWQTLKGGKHDWRHYLSSSQVAIDNGYVELAKGVGYPAVIILDAKDGEPLKKFKLTGGAKEIENAFNAVVKP